MSVFDYGALDADATRWQAMADVAALHEEAYRRILDASVSAITARGHFVLVLAGGNTPAPIYAALRDADTDWVRPDTGVDETLTLLQPHGLLFGDFRLGQFGRGGVVGHDAQSYR